MRVAFVLLIAGVAVVISGCSGGSGNGHTDRDAYFDAFQSGFGCATAAPDSSTPDSAGSVAEAQRQLDAFAALTPPPELASAHRQLLDAWQAMLDLVSATGGATPAPSDVSVADAERALFRAQAKWQDAFASYYGLRRQFRMEGASMEPAFHNNDLLAFRPYKDEELGRWQVILFRFPLDESRMFVKRIVGLPGETVEIRNEKILINGAVVDGDVFALEGANYTYGPIMVPAESYFVLGDNRRNSYDSHAWGNTCPATQTCDFVPKDHVIGEMPVAAERPLSPWWCPSPPPTT